MVRSLLRGSHRDLDRETPLMSLCWQTDINSSNGSENVIRSRDHVHKLSLQKQTVFQKVPCRDAVSTKLSGAVSQSERKTTGAASPW
ncbi:hypothetical protein AMECASPLE_039310 [Ameca splendens]|uniref:Uncharacterized protein n=1 Tax=Ameca splendens TaxID=208324 RepID=A0ABV0XXM8_9TELE